eukprot:TRINITY_DN67920_c8_g4_i1.p1 TRINITY_DN67920_c8_g4~~TRINITY_DN67920_c8_g4_i1.p1  ORF type:complete len:449 (-),score=84.83 TRINITY_DN67920_c8_g4_i1:1464-2810(-)
MDEEYDVVVCGTGLTECILSGLLSVEGKKVLHLDKNGYYGGESASLSLEQLFEKYQRGEIPKDLGASREYNVDLIPKLLMAAGKITRILRKTGVSKYNLEFTQLDGSFVWIKGKLHKVPCTPKEVLSSSLMGMFEKRRCGKFFSWMDDYDQEKPETHKPNGDATQISAKNVLAKYSLEPQTIDFIGHAVALYTNDDFLEQPSSELVKKCKLYHDSLNMFGSSPYIYPVYGLGDLPQAFARLCAVHGGTFMLNTPVDKVVNDDNGHVTGIQSGENVIKAKMIIADPTYFPDKCKKVGQVARCICLLDHMVPGLPKESKDAASAQIILPQKELKRKNDVFIVVLSYVHRVVPKGHYLALVSTAVETENPEKELEQGLALLGPIKQKFLTVSDVFEPIEDGAKDGIYISKSYDSLTHFESAADDMLDIYQRVTGNPLDWEKVNPSGDADEQ